MAWYKIADLLGGTVPVGTPVTVKGWVRTRRDSKAGLSFLHVHDGTCFDPIQAVIPAALSNYQVDVARLTAGCSVEVDGALVASEGKGQAFEIKADAVRVVGWVDDPDTYPISPKRHTFEYLREVAHLRPRTNTFGAVARVRHTVAMAIHRFFHERGFFWVHTPIITASDAEGAGELFRVSTLDLDEPAAHAGGRHRFRAGLLRQAVVSHRVGPAQRRVLLPGAQPRLHVRADVPRRELEHEPPPGRVLDDRAGDRVRQPRRQRETRRGLPAGDHPRRARRAPGRHGVLRRARRQDLHRAPRGVPAPRASSG